jgi:hypothetical protein
MHTGSCDLTNMNMDVMPVTEKAFSAKYERVKITVRDNKTAAWIVEQRDDTSLRATVGRSVLRFVQFNCVSFLMACQRI